MMLVIYFDEQPLRQPHHSLSAKQNTQREPANERKRTNAQRTNAGASRMHGHISHSLTHCHTHTHTQTRTPVLWDNGDEEQEQETQEQGQGQGQGQEE